MLSANDKPSRLCLPWQATPEVTHPPPEYCVVGHCSNDDSFPTQSALDSSREAEPSPNVSALTATAPLHR